MTLSVFHSTLRHGLCIGCGVCELVCPEKAVQVTFSNRGEWIAHVDASRCTNCGICVGYCPHSREDLYARAGEVSSGANPGGSGLEDRECYLAFDLGPGRRRSASGGIVTRWLGDRLEAGDLDGVFHGEALTAMEGEPHFQAAFSRNVSELDRRRGSFYAPLCFAAVVDSHARDRKRNLAMVATPCVIRGYRLLFDEHPGFRGNRVVFIALACSHNVSHHFTDCLYRSMGLPRGRAYRLDFRSKTDIPHAGRYRIRIIDGDGHLIAHPDRMECVHTRMWRSYAFALKPCHYCPDFWGAEADLSVKDAWGSWAQEPAGTSLAAVGHPDIRREFAAGHPGLFLEKISAGEFVHGQAAMAEYRLGKVLDRWDHSPFHFKNMRSGYLRHFLVSAFVRQAWPRLGFRVTRAGVRILGGLYDFLHWGVARFKRLCNGTGRLVRSLLAPFFWPLRLLPRRREVARTDRILVVGGFGYGNLGDEAQLHTTWKRLEKIFPGHLITVLSPDPRGTHRLHGCSVGEAPRLAFFDEDRSPLYRINTRGRRAAFLLRCLGIYLGAHLVRRGFSACFLKPRRAALLNELHTASMVVFSGGGYLTGATRSRLWDGALIACVCGLFRTPLALSGQTMGLWGGRFSRILAGRGFRHAALIGLRDPESSPKDLQAAGVPGDRVWITHDDALFSESASAGAVRRVLMEAGVTPRQLNAGYRVLQFHYWGRRSPAGKIETLDAVETVARLMAADNIPLILVSMTPADDRAVGDLKRRCPDLAFAGVTGQRDFRVVRGVIAGSRACVAMKHHPLIFALGQSVPVISLARGSYYAHKNAGALGLYGLGDFNLDMEDDNWLDQLKELLLRVDREAMTLKLRIREVNRELRRRGREFDERLKAVIPPAEGGPG